MKNKFNFEESAVVDIETEFWNNNNLIAYL